MKKRSLALALALCLALGMTACTGGGEQGSPSPAPTDSAQPSSPVITGEPAAAKFTPGTYTASEQGNNGPVTLSVTFSENEITEIKVVESTETGGIGSTAVEKLIGQITEGQTLAVDGVSGATNSSNAVLAIVKNCVEQAGGDVNALMKADGNSTTGEVKELSTQLLVVGAGGAGMVAAIRAAQEGMKVLLLEKQSFTGGATAISGGSMIVACSKVQKELGVTDDTPESMAEDLFKYGHDRNDPNMVSVYANNAGKTIDWLIDSVSLKIDFEKGLEKNAEHSSPRVLYTVDGAPGLGRMLRAGVDATEGITLMTETRAESLIVENGAVVGVKAVGSDGTQYNIKADKTILATGGYGYNKDMLTGSLKSALYYGPVSSTGDGHKMLEAVDAAFQNMEIGKIYPNGVEVSAGKAKSTLRGTSPSFAAGSILVNAEGNRVINEKASYPEIKEVMFAQKEEQLYLVMDANTFENIFVPGVAANSITPEEIEGWLANNGSTTPVFAHGETLEEAAKAAGVDPENLKATVERYNAMVDAGVDEDFGRPAEFLQSKISEGPYYIVEQKGRFAITLGGAVANESMQVLNTSGQVVPNLYIAGELAGGALGDDLPQGGTVGWALTSGWAAANAVLADK